MADGRIQKPQENGGIEKQSVPEMAAEYKSLDKEAICPRDGCGIQKPR